MRITVAGAGIGGLSCALALQRTGHEVEVYESAPQITPVGAGIWLSPNGQEVLRRIDTDVLDEVVAAGRLMDEAVIVTSAGKTLSRIAPEMFGGRYRCPRILAISRPRLHHVLHGALRPGTVRLGRRLAGFEDSGDGVTATFSEGAGTADRARSDVLIGADGIHSTVRAGLFGEMALRYSGQTCWRSLSPFSLEDQWAGRGTEIWADEAGLRAGFSQVAEGQVYLYVTALAEPDQRQDADSAKADLLGLARAFPPVVGEIIEATPAEGLIRSDLSDLPPLKSYVSGRVAVLGDAAHATTPNLGQGANQAMESALAITHYLTGAGNPAPALRAYEKARIAKASFIVNTSWRLNRLINLRSRRARRVRDAVMSRVPEAMAARQFHRVLDVPELA
jgi:2-polyprenyl-6-methoxyphenol hydroxylase-like FAD-dependent oxidoreductase